MSNLVNMTSTSTESAVEVKNLENPAETVSTVKISKKAKFKLAKKQTVKTDAEIVAPTLKPSTEYRPLLSLERSIADDSESIVLHPRAHYESEYNRSLKATALSTLKMCRTVYEAHIALDTYEFKRFCKTINESADSSKIRKLISIGKVYPRLVKFADQLASGWTTIYQITQIPADTFEKMSANKESLRTLRGKTLADLVSQSKSVKDLNATMRRNKKTNSFTFAEVHALRKLDADDFRIIEKALSEVEARLPIRFNFLPGVKSSATTLRMINYEKLKKEFADEKTLEPEKWDLGHIANSVLPKTEAVENSNQS